MGKGSKKKFVKLNEFEEKQKNIPKCASDKNQQLSSSDTKIMQQKTGSDSGTHTSETNATEAQSIDYLSSDKTHNSECKNKVEEGALSQSEIDNPTELVKAEHVYRDRNFRSYNQHSDQFRGTYAQNSANRNRREGNYSNEKTKYDDDTRDKRQYGNRQNYEPWRTQAQKTWDIKDSSMNNSGDRPKSGGRGRNFGENNSVGNYSERTGRNFRGNNSRENFSHGNHRPTAGRGRFVNQSYVESSSDQRRNHSNNKERLNTAEKQSAQSVWNNENYGFKQESFTHGDWRVEEVSFQKPGDPESVAEETDSEKTRNNNTSSFTLNPSAPSFSPTPDENEWDADEADNDIIIEKTNDIPQSYEETNKNSNTQANPQIMKQDSFVNSKRDNSSHSSKEIDSALENMSFSSDEWSYKPSYKNFKEKYPSRSSSQKQYDSENQPTMSRPSRQSLNNLSNVVKNDKEWDAFMEFMNSTNVNKYDKVIERDQDLFTIDEAYSLAHCVAEDMNMGSGIAVEFRRKFKKVEDLLQQRQRTGGLAFLKEGNRYVYYLVTKPESSGKPTYATFWSALKKLRQCIEEDEVKKLAIPRIGCGLDRLEWNIVKPMLEYLFSNLDIEIIVCNFQQEDPITPNKPRSCRVVYEKYPIAEIAEMTLIIYFASKDGIPSEVMISLDKKFNFLTEFKASRKNLGDVICFDKKKDYLLCGCIVKETVNGLFDFKNFMNCLQTIASKNKKDRYEYVGFENVKNKDDPMLNAKILNLMRHTLRFVDIHCCNFSTESSIQED